jgi:hypothetical protein
VSASARITKGVSSTGASAAAVVDGGIGCAPAVMPRTSSDAARSGIRRKVTKSSTTAAGAVANGIWVAEAGCSRVRVNDGFPKIHQAMGDERDDDTQIFKVTADGPEAAGGLDRSRHGDERRPYQRGRSEVKP